MCTVFLFCFFTVWLSSLVFWIEINCILPVALSGIGSHQWSGRPPAAEILETWAASSLAWVDVRGESSSGLSLVVLFLSHRACFPNSPAPLLAFLVWYQCPHVFLSEPVSAFMLSIFVHIKLQWTQSQSPNSFPATKISHMRPCPLLQSPFRAFQFVLTYCDCICLT